MDPAALERALARQGVRAVVLTHLYGRMADVEAVSEICERYRVPWIEDCAQAHGASLDGRRAGSWGRAAAFSFYPTKNLGALGDGGAVVTSDPAIDRAVRELRQYGWSERYRATRPGGRNSRLDELQAAVLRRFLPELDRWNAERRSIATRYLRALGRSGVVPPDPGGDEMVWHLFVVRANDREGFRGALRERGIGTDVHYPIADHRQPAGMVDVALPRTELACDTVVSLPLFPELREEEIARVCRALEEVTVE
jgi:dTDP-4-amino-4,6-dideoxygalactose transaminase